MHSQCELSCTVQQAGTALLHYGVVRLKAVHKGNLTGEDPELYAYPGSAACLCVRLSENIFH